MQDRAPRVGDYAPMAQDVGVESSRVASIGDSAAGWRGLGLALASVALLGLTLGRVRRRASRT
jgi:hypothetical protein